MPRYDYAVLDERGEPTGEKVELCYSFGQARPETVTLDDGRTARYDFSGTVRHVKTQPTDGYPHELMCFSTTPAQVAEFRARYPNRTYTDAGELLTHSKSETDRIAREEGCVDQSRPAPLRHGRQTLMRVSHV